MLKGRDKIQPNCVQGCYQSHVFPNSRLSLFPSVNVLCIDLIRAPTLQWGSITGGVLSPEENWCSLTKEKWIFKLIVSWEPRIQIHVSSGLSLYSLKGANQNYLTWTMSPRPRLIPRPRPPELNPRSVTCQAYDRGQVISPFSVSVFSSVKGT